MLLVAMTVLTGYQRYLQGAVGQFLPPVPAGAIGWLVSGLMAWLVVREAWSEVRRARAEDKLA